MIPAMHFMLPFSSFWVSIVLFQTRSRTTAQAGLNISILGLADCMYQSLSSAR